MVQGNSSAYWFGILIGGLIVGIIFGLVPLSAGILKKRVSLGVAGLISCAIGGMILGLILAIPIAAVFTLIIVLHKTENNFQSPPPPPNFENPTAEYGNRETGETK